MVCSGGHAMVCRECVNGKRWDAMVCRGVLWCVAMVCNVVLRRDIIVCSDGM